MKLTEGPKVDLQAELNHALGSLWRVDGEHIIGPIPDFLRDKRYGHILAELLHSSRVVIMRPQRLRPFPEPAEVDNSRPQPIESATIFNVPIRSPLDPGKRWTGLGVHHDDAAKLYRWDEELKREERRNQAHRITDRAPWERRR